jgi:hypothetical protein
MNKEPHIISNAYLARIFGEGESVSHALEFIQWLDKQINTRYETKGKHKA